MDAAARTFPPSIGFAGVRPSLGSFFRFRITCLDFCSRTFLAAVVARVVITLPSHICPLFVLVPSSWPVTQNESALILPSTVCDGDDLVAARTLDLEAREAQEDS